MQHTEHLGLLAGRRGQLSHRGPRVPQPRPQVLQQPQLHQPPRPRPGHPGLPRQERRAGAAVLRPGRVHTGGRRRVSRGSGVREVHRSLAPGELNYSNAYTVRRQLIPKVAVEIFLDVPLTGIWLLTL